MIVCYSTVPMFIHAHKRWRRLYYGICLGGEFRTSFEMSHLKSTPPQYNHLAGLLDVFKDKLVSSGFKVTAHLCKVLSVYNRESLILGYISFKMIYKLSSLL